MSQVMISGLQGSGWQMLSKALSRTGVDCREFIPGNRPAKDGGPYILFYARPEFCMLQDGALTPDAWLAGAGTLLRFVHAHRQRSLLFDVEQCLEHPVAFIRMAAQFSGVSPDGDISIEPGKKDMEKTCISLLEILSDLIPLKNIETIYNDLFVTAVPLGDVQYLPAHKRMKALARNMNCFLADPGERETLVEAGKKAQEELETLREKIEEQNQDQELSLLQINQLQEELEYYYNRYTQIKGAADHVEVKDISRMICPGRGLPVLASRADITGSYEMEGYSNLEVCLFNLILADGRHSPQLPFKLVVNSGCAGVEFRQQEGIDEDYVKWPGAMKDEYGPYLLLIPNPIEEMARDQQALWDSMRASDYNLVEGALQAVTGLWDKNLVGNSHDLEDSKLRFWKLAAGDCLDQIGYKPETMRYDQALVREQYQDHDYEHLWLAFRNLRLGNRFFRNFDFKVQASSLGGRKAFANHMSLSFRNIEEDGVPPLSAWPPDQADDFGAQLVYHLNFKEAQTGLEGSDRLTQDDSEMIKLLIHSLPSVLARMEPPAGEGERPLEQWKVLADAGRQIQIRADNRQQGKMHRMVRKVRDITRSALGKRRAQ